MSGRATKGGAAVGVILPMLALLSGCGGPPPPPPPTVVNATVASTADTNSNGSGAGAPVAIRVYQLVSPAGFGGAQFFALFDKDAATLKDDLVKRDDLLLAPGQSRSLTIMPEDRAHAIGVFAAYRDYEHVHLARGGRHPGPPDQHVDRDPRTKAGVTATIKPAKPAK